MSGVSRLVEVEDLSVAFPDGDGTPVRVVDGVHLAVDTGEMVALAGASGSGKSLTALAVLGLVPEPGRVVGGLVRLHGVDVRTASDATLRGIRGRVAALVQQEPSANFNPVLRLWAQVSEAAARHRLVRGTSVRRALAGRLLGEVGLEEPEALARAYPHQLSGGQRQRAAVAAALAADPLVLLADEPTSALDSVSQAELLRLLARLLAERGLGVLLITHDLDLAVMGADRLVVLHAGETVEDGPRAQVLAGPAHPYTQVLLVAGGAGSRRAGGSNATERSRCRFVDACPRAMPRCRRLRPALAPGPGGRRVRCFLWSDDAEQVDG